MKTNYICINFPERSLGLFIVYYLKWYWVLFVFSFFNWTRFFFTKTVQPSRTCNSSMIKAFHKQVLSFGLILVGFFFPLSCHHLCPLTIFLSFPSMPIFSSLSLKKYATLLLQISFRSLLLWLPQRFLILYNLPSLKAILNLWIYCPFFA